MTREEAITYGERKKARIKERLCRDGSSYGDHSFYYSEMEFTSAALSALQDQEERENPKPLTIEDLKQSEGRSVWWDWCGEYCLCKKEYVVTSNGTFSFNFVVNNGNAYRNKPKEETP